VVAEALEAEVVAEDVVEGVDLATEEAEVASAVVVVRGVALVTVDEVEAVAEDLVEVTEGHEVDSVVEVAVVALVQGAVVAVSVAVGTEFLFISRFCYLIA